MKKMADKTILITGGARGIGYGIAKAFAEQGANIVITGRTASTLIEARENLETIIDTVCYEYNEPKPRTYRNRENLKYCKAQGIRFSGLALGRPKKDPAENRKIIYKDAVDRIEIERSFSLAKRCYGLGLIWTKLDTTTKNSICLSIIALNVDRLTAISFCDFLNLIFQSAWRRYRGMSISTNRQLDIVTV